MRLAVCEWQNRTPFSYLDGPDGKAILYCHDSCGRCAGAGFYHADSSGRPMAETHLCGSRRCDGAVLCVGRFVHCREQFRMVDGLPASYVLARQPVVEFQLLVYRNGPVGSDPMAGDRGVISWFIRMGRAYRIHIKKL